MMKNAFFLVLFFSGLIYSETLPADKARGLFIAFGVGPRLPIAEFSNSTDLGYGFNLEFSYTDNEYIPLFLFAKAGFEQYPGSQEFYQSGDHSNLSTTSIPINFGARYYFPPILENIFLLIPIVEASAAYSYYEILHEFKSGTGKNNYTEENSKLGFTAGAGISMFMMEILAAYNFFENKQFIAVDLKIRLPLYVVF